MCVCVIGGIRRHLGTSEFGLCGDDEDETPSTVLQRKGPVAQSVDQFGALQLGKSREEPGLLIVVGLAQRCSLFCLLK